jgi:hypothetical protein
MVPSDPVAPILLGRVSETAAAMLGQHPNDVAAPVVSPSADQSLEASAAARRQDRITPADFQPVETFVLERPRGPLQQSSRRSSWVGLVNGLVVVTLILVGALLKADSSFPGWWQRLAQRAQELPAAALERLDTVLVAPTRTEKLVAPTDGNRPRLVGGISRAIRGQPAPLGLSLQGHVSEGVVLVRGLSSEMTLSTGSAVAGNAWQLLATDAALGNAWVMVPKDFIGAVDLVSELHLRDGTLIDRAQLRLEWQSGPSASAGPLELKTPQPPPPAPPPQTSAPQPKLDHEEIALMVSNGKSLMESGDLAAARLVLQRAAEANDPEAALVLGATYDPVVLRELKVYGLAADVAQARRWYEKAEELGSAEAPRRLGILANAAK